MTERVAGSQTWGRVGRGWRQEEREDVAARVAEHNISPANPLARLALAEDRDGSPIKPVLACVSVGNPVP